MLSGHGGVSENTNKVVTGNARKLETQGAKNKNYLQHIEQSKVTQGPEHCH